MALGASAAATGVNSIAIGTGAVATGSIAAGTQAFASNGGAAFGDFAAASGANSTAVGPNSSAAYANSAAFGNGATATRANQQVFGTASNTYTMSGLTSSASKQAQGSPTHLVTSNQAGDLAAYTPHQLDLASASEVASGFSSLQSQVNHLVNRDNQLTEGIAASAALAQPVILPGQHFAMRAGWGGYDGSNAFAFSAAGVVGNNLLRPGFGTFAVDGGVGVGTDEGEVVGRAGASFGW
jgi:autotransporter adhesin